MIQDFAFGVDLGWTEQLEQLGYHWIDDDGKKIDPIVAAKDLGADAVRLRVFVNPPKEAFWTKHDGVTTCMLGYCDAKSVLRMSQRVNEAGMKLMIDFHYSDHFADPLCQDIPQEWEELDEDSLANCVAEHTKTVLTLLKDNDIKPDWVQVGNEINAGIMHPMGDFENHPRELVHYLNAGYDAVKEVYEDLPVITHLAAVNEKSWCEPFLDSFIKNNGKTDILGFSYYPYWAKEKTDAIQLKKSLEEYSHKLQKPVMVVEVGGDDSDWQVTYQTIKDGIFAQKDMDGTGLGIFYWEPEANREILPDKYPLGAAELVSEKTLRYTKALSIYKDFKAQQF